MDKINLAEIARIAQVSKATVSRVINRSSSVSVGTTNTVLEVIDQMNLATAQLRKTSAIPTRRLIRAKYRTQQIAFISDCSPAVLNSAVYHRLLLADSVKTNMKE